MHAEGDGNDVEEVPPPKDAGLWDVASPLPGDVHELDSERLSPRLGCPRLAHAARLPFLLLAVLRVFD